MATSIQVVFDCTNPDGLAHFWATALGYKLQDPPPGYNSWEDWLKANGYPQAEWDRASAIVDPAGVGPRIFFQKVPESKIVKNRVHLDLNVGGGRATPLAERKQNIAAEIERLGKVGATKIRDNAEHEEFSVVMQDPEGNEFCLQ